MRVYLQLVKHFTSFAVFHRRPKFPGTTMMPGNPTGPARGPDAPPKATQPSSELMTRARRPRTRHHVKPLNVG